MRVFAELSQVVAATIASKRQLALARVTAESFRQHHPDIPFFTLLADEEQGCFDPAQEPYRTLKLNQLQIEEPLGFRFQYSEMELSYACTPFLIDYLIEAGYEGVVFLKQETLVLDSLAPVFDELQRHSVLLTPHYLEPPGGASGVEWELKTLRAGVFNGGFLAFSNREESRRLLAWWKRKTRRGCFRAVDQGVHFEQRWLDFFPSFAPDAHILRDPGMNVGHWNLAERRIRVRQGRVTAGSAPCRVFRFSGYEPERPRMVTKYNPHLTVASTGEAAEVFHRYQTMLDAAGYREARQWPYAYGAYDNGVPIKERDRRIYHDLDGAAVQFGNSFTTARPGSFFRWLAAGCARPAEAVGK